MKKAFALLLTATILALLFTACGDNSTESDKSTGVNSEAVNSDEKEKISESTTTATSTEDNQYAKWNSTFIAENGDSMTFDISDSGYVDYNYKLAAGGSSSFADENTEINDNKITMNGSDFDTEYGAEFTLDGDVLHCYAWNKMVEEAEKYVYIDTYMYRDGKLPSGSLVTIPEVTTAVTVIPEDIQYIYKTVRSDEGYGDDYYAAGEYMEVVYNKTGGIQFAMVFMTHNPNTYASYASESEIGTYTTVQSYSGNGDIMDSEYLGEAKIEFSGEYAYVTFEDGDTIELIKAY